MGTGAGTGVGLGLKGLVNGSYQLTTIREIEVQPSQSSVPISEEEFEPEPSLSNKNNSTIHQNSSGSSSNQEITRGEQLVKIAFEMVDSIETSVWEATFKSC